MRVDKSDIFLAAVLVIVGSATVYLRTSQAANPPLSGKAGVVPAISPALTSATSSPSSLSATNTLNDSLKLGGCAAIPGTLERLQCYDGLAAANGVAPSSTSANGDSGKWDVTESVNPVDDTKTVILSVTAGNVKSQYSKDIDLILRCKSGQTEVYVSWNSFLGSGQIETIMRLDSKPAEHSSWSLSSDNEAAFYPGNTVKFIKSLMKTSEVVAQVTPYDASPVTAIFDTTGLSSIIKPLSEACKWRLN